MKKIPKKVLLTATVFAAALNMNGCGTYGPPPEHVNNEDVQVLEMQAENLVVGDECIESEN